MRISDWSSDVCSSDLKGLDSNGALQHYALRSSHLEAGEFWVEIRNDVSSSAIKIDCSEMPRFQRCLAQADELAPVARLTIDQQRGRRIDRKSVVSGKSVSVRVELGGRGIIKNKKIKKK